SESDRIGHSLSEGENMYRSVRKLSVQKWLVKNNIPCSLSKVPNIAILGSGGGERAMVGMLGSLSKMGEQGLLDAALYMSGVSGSTWCMASLYEKANWSSDMKQIKVVAERLGHSSVSLKDKVWKLKKYHQTNDNFSLTDVWAALLVTTIVKKIDESTLSNYQTCHDQDPYPIYTVIDQDCKYEHLLRETFFELTPHEVGYTLAGAFVETSSFGSIFNKGVLTTPKPEMDMTYLQGLCGSALADVEVILTTLKEWLKARFYISEFVEWMLKSIYAWGANYNFLHKMNGRPRKTTHFEDAGLLENSPYMSALRAEREIDLIISFDFSAGNPMEVRTKECKKLDISFPAINYTKTDKDFYVFKGLKKAPTVIHIPLFNVANCGSELEAYRDKYRTFQGAYSPEMIEDLMKKAGENVLNNKEKLLREIAGIVQQK
uniref:PLA2c domain-containing protein n=1 Tax=Gadus morhua TaxID=8049 RepID=A0A8C5AX46_GADMO